MSYLYLKVIVALLFAASFMIEEVKPVLFSSRKKSIKIEAPSRRSTGLVTPRSNKASEPNLIPDDKEHHLAYRKNKDVLIGRYKIVDTLGEGTFGRVAKAFDMKRKRYVAIKIIKNVQKYADDAQVEIKMLDFIDEKQGSGKQYCLQILNDFDYGGHVCIVIEALGLSLYEFMIKNNLKRYTLDETREIAYQLCAGVAFLHSIGMIHTDIKIENILFADDIKFTPCNKTDENGIKREVHLLKNINVRIIDFGTALLTNQTHIPGLICTSYYRAPEVRLKMLGYYNRQYSYPVDVWSIACVLFELYRGFPLFDCYEVETDAHRKHLIMMEMVLHESIPADMIDAKWDKNIDWDKGEAREFKNRYKPLEGYLFSQNEDHVQFFKFLRRMLKYRPKDRATLSEVLSDPFFDKLFPSPDPNVSQK